MNMNGIGSCLRKMVFTVYFHAVYVHTYALEGKFWTTVRAGFARHDATNTTCTASRPT